MRLPLYRYSYHQTELMLLFKIMNSEITSLMLFSFLFRSIGVRKITSSGFFATPNTSPLKLTVSKSQVSRLTVALIRAMVPIEIKSSKSSPVLLNFSRLWTQPYVNHCCQEWKAILCSSTNSKHPLYKYNECLSFIT